MKKTVSRIITGVLCLSLVTGAIVMPQSFEKGISITASAEQTDTGFTYSIENNEVTITGYTGTATELEIPGEMGGLPVTGLCYSAFENCENLTSVTIPDTVTTIGERAFSCCNNLSSVSLGKSVQNIESSNFEALKNLEAITVDEENKYFCDVDGVLFSKDKTKIFSYPSGKKENIYTVPDTVVCIAYSAFSSADNLNQVILPNSLKTIESAGFIGCDNLKSVEIPDSVEIIGSFAFSFNKSLTSVAIGNSIQNIDSGAFADCENLTSVNIPSSIQSIKYCTFRGCKSLELIKIPDSVTTIEQDAFTNCDSLLYIEIPKSVNHIENDAFGCYYGGVTTTLIPGFKIYGYLSSVAETYANENEITFISIDKVQVGDTNFDGQISVSDIVLLNQYVKNQKAPDDVQKQYSDINGDGRVNSLDTAALKTKLLAE